MSTTYGSFDDERVVDNGSTNPSAALRFLPCTSSPGKESNSSPRFENGGTGGSRVSSNGTKLVFRNICVTVGQTQILRNVSGVARSGEILAILGPSGAGKSTLLNVLAGRLVAAVGYVSLDGQEVTRPMRRKISYVHQQDVFYPGLTLRETLTFTAMLRLPDSMSRDQKIHRIQEVVDLLELNKCIGTKMGGVFDAGLSGGERKRASIACELITNPKILILDEPTSGLDSAIALSLMLALTDYARDWNKTVITTIHQPSSQMFHMFTNVLLLTDGQMAYYGPRCKIVEHFARMGLRCDPQYNPADFVMEQLKTNKETINNMISAALESRDEDDRTKGLKGNGSDVTDKHRKWEMTGNGRLPKTTDTWLHSDVSERGGLLEEGRGLDPESGDSDPGTAAGLASSSGSKWPTGFVTQYKTLTRRAFVLSRGRFLSLTNFCQIFIISFTSGLEWFQMPRTEERAEDRLGLIFNIILQQSFFFIYISLFLIFDDYGVFMRERSAGIYRLSAYYLSVITAELPTTFILQGVFLNIAYWMTGLMPQASNYFAFWATHLLTVFLAQSIGLFVGAAVPNKTNAMTLSTTMMVIFLLTGGFYNAHVPDWLLWSRYVSFTSYAMSALCEIEFTHGYPLRCSDANITAFPQYCLNGTSLPGKKFVERSNIQICSFSTAVIVLLSISVFLRTVTYVIIRFFRRPKC